MPNETYYDGSEKQKADRKESWRIPQVTAKALGEFADIGRWQSRCPGII
jgi:hypothetical protein